MSVASDARFVTGAAAFFGAMYFVQGIGDPTSGLIAQPVRAMLKSWGESPSAIGGFMALLALPWMLKPAFGLLSDYVPLFGSHRRNYLLVATAAASIGLFVLYTLHCRTAHARCCSSGCCCRPSALPLATCWWMR
ncbi:MAG: folate/biopterin family MFS transporter [Gammaproteobacteria bacterium]|nr:folate/biopterin family MFS transporter [Gammaproteobacteria bacterium]